MGRFFPHADLTDIIRNMKARGQRDLQRDVHVSRGRRHRVRQGARERGAPGRHRARRAARSRSISTRRVATHDEARDPLRAARLVGAVQPSSSRWRGARARPVGLHLEQGARLQPRLRPKGAAGTSTGSTSRTASASFYRVGFYDNIFDTDRMSLYVELGFARDAAVDVEAMRERVLADLRAEGVITDHQLVAEHSVVMDPAYVHITQRSIAEHARLSRDPARQRRLLRRPLRRLDLLQHRGQHRRGARARRRLRPPRRVVVPLPTASTDGRQMSGPCCNSNPDVVRGDTCPSRDRRHFLQMPCFYRAAGPVWNVHRYGSDAMFDYRRIALWLAVLLVPGGLLLLPV